MARIAWGCVAALMFVVVLSTAGCSGEGMDSSTVPAGGGETEVSSSPGGANDAGCLFGGCGIELEDGATPADPAPGSPPSNVEPPPKGEAVPKPVKFKGVKDGDLGTCTASSNNGDCQEEIAASGGSGKYVWSAEGMPGGMTLDGGTEKKAVVRVEPSKVGLGEHSFRVTVSDAEDASNNDSREYSITVREKFTIEARDCESDKVLNNGTALTVSWEMKFCFAVAGGIGTEYTWEARCAMEDGNPQDCGALRLEDLDGNKSQQFVVVEYGNTNSVELKGVSITAINSIGDEGTLSYDTLTFAPPKATSSAAESGTDAKLGSSTPHPVLGGDGGEPFFDACDPGEGVTKINLWSGSVIDQIQIFCEPLKTIEDDDVEPNEKDEHGGSGGAPSSVLAPPGFVFVGFEAKTGDGIIIELRPIARRVRQDGLVVQYDWDGGKFGKGDGGREWHSVRCGEGEILTGIHGRSGDYLDKLGPICRQVSSKSISYRLDSNKNPKEITQDNSGGQACALTCDDSDHPQGMVVGLAWKQNDIPVIIEISLICGDLQSDGLTEKDSWYSATCGKGDGAKPWNNYAASPGHAVIGFKHSDGDRLDSIRLKSAPPLFVVDQDEEKLFGFDTSWGIFEESSALGGGGGEEREESMCGQEEVLTGITFAAGADVDDVIGFECAKIEKASQ